MKRESRRVDRSDHVDSLRLSVFQRMFWDGTPRAVAEWWTLTEGQRRAVCRMFTHLLGHELRLEVSRELVSSDVCRTDEEVIACQEQWRASLEAKGWKCRRKSSSHR